MKKYFPFLILIISVVFLSACISQASPVPEMVGESAPEFTLDNALGSRYSLSDREDRPVLLYFHMAVG